MAYFLASLLQVHPRCHQHHGFLPSKSQLVFGSPGSCGYVWGTPSRELSRRHGGDAHRLPAGYGRHTERDTHQRRWVVRATCKTRAHSNGTGCWENWGCAAPEAQPCRDASVLAGRAAGRVVKASEPLENPTCRMFSPQER
ncbi:unnamed protein product [Gulo gulo]|uniref:Uncharacterized protein n=1 Tax=Gulo gulo TaxID=48420 RepID=A0A9X9LS22_GULGU|nr:unnamed protein product [Gulo gulo]